MNPGQPPISSSQDLSSPPPSRIIGKGEMADRVRAYDWASTPLGPIESWSKELITIVNLTLASPLPARTMWGPDFVLIYNDAYRAIVGPRHPAALGKAAESVYPESWHVVGPLLDNAFAAGETLFYEKLLVPLPTANGIEDRYLNYSFNPIFEDGKIAGLFGPLHDVTTEVLAVRQLEASEARAHRILQSIGDAVIVTDANACITHINPVAQTLTGWPLAEARGRALTEVFQIYNESTREPVESPAAKVQRLGTIVGLANHTILKAKDGNEHHIDDSGAPIRNEAGDLSGIVLVFRDVTEQRTNEESLRIKTEEAERQRAEIESVYHNAPIGLALFDVKDFRYLRLNDRQAAFFALKPEQVVGRTLTEMAPIEGLRELFEQVAAGIPVVNYPLEGTVINDPDTHRYWTVSYYPVYANDGSVQAITAAFLEVTSQKKTEKALLQSEKLAAVGRLASSIAHEINNPLESVMNLIYLARQYADLPKVQELLDMADQEIRRVSVIANQTLRFHKQPSNPQAITSPALFGTVLSIYEGKLRNSNVTVETRFRTDKPIVCFEGDVRQVLNNLIGNAIDAMTPGSPQDVGRLIIRSRVGTHWSTGRQGLFLTVADTGCGMTPQVAANIFEPFFTTKGIAGTGLGLWVSQEIVTRHAGVLRVRSSQRHGHCGTVFALFLPFEAAQR